NSTFTYKGQPVDAKQGLSAPTKRIYVDYQKELDRCTWPTRSSCARSRRSSPMPATRARILRRRSPKLLPRSGNSVSQTRFWSTANRELSPATPGFWPCGSLESPKSRRLSSPISPKRSARPVDFEQRQTAGGGYLLTAHVDYASGAAPVPE